jgi:hypothetical protein
MRLPVYEQQVRLQGRNRTDLNVRATPNAFGAQVGAAVQGLGDSVARIAEAKAFKDSVVADADAKAGLNEYLDYSRNVMYDPQKGALNQTGSNGMAENRANAEARLAERRKAIEEKLGPQARKVFQDAADRLDDNSADALIKHDAEQTRTYVNGQSQALTENFMKAAVDNYGDDAKWNEFMGAAMGEIARTGQLNGLSPETIALKQQEALTAAHSNRAIRIAYDDPIKADEYLETNREKLGEAEYSRLKSGMEAAVVEHKADKYVQDLMGGDGYIGAGGTSSTGIDNLGRETYIVGVESSGRTDATNPNSTATGSVQFLDGTYLEWVGKVSPEWAAGMSREEILATRTDPVKEAEIYRAFRDNNLAVLESKGLADTPRNRYVMHHFGVGGGARMLEVEAAGQGNVPVVDIVGQEVVDKNPHIKGKTVSGALAVLQGKVSAHGKFNGPGTQEPAMPADTTWLKYSNQKAVRNDRLSPQLVNSMAFLGEMGITMEVFSGGQESNKPGEGTGSERHNHGNSADVEFYKDGRKLSPKNPEDRAILTQIIQTAMANGVTGFGEGDDYMGEGRIHVGFGDPGVWGKGGKGENAPEWLVQAFNSGTLGAAPAASGGMSTRSAYEAVMAIEDPKVRAAAMAKLDAQLKTEAALTAADQKAASDEAWRLYTQNGMKPEQVPMDLQIKMGREATLNFFESARAYESGTLVTDELRYSELQRLAVEDPKTFSEMDLSYDRKNFSKSDFRAIEQMQLELLQGMEANDGKARDALNDPATMKGVYDAAERVYQDAVPSKESRRSQEEAAAYNRFQEQVKSYARDFMTEKGRPMTFDEQDRLFSMLLTPVVIENNSGIFGSSRDAMLFDAPFREPGERVRGNVPAGDITLADEEEARAELQAFYGREPSEDEITVHHNRKLLADMGISPEMEYSEVPRDIRRKLGSQYPDASDEELVDLYIDFVLETAKRQ